MTGAHPARTTAGAPADCGQRQGLRLICRGVVQGVGFRPAVARLAGSLNLEGSLSNIPGAVQLELAGARQALERFLSQLPAALSPPAQLEALQITWLPLPLPAALAEGSGLQIRAETPRALGIGLVAPSLAADRAPCAPCRHELSDPLDRRFGYPFISCCSCGPRYSIATSEPFSRAHTTLAGFPLCALCQAEFEDPANRRFHAETIGCPACGPQLQLLDASGRRLAGARLGPAPPAASNGRDAPSSGRSVACTASLLGPPTAAEAQGSPEQRPPDEGTTVGVLETAVRLLRSGAILALQGVGGFQLLVDAGHAQAVARLRARKQRPHKPFALLVDSLERLEGLLHPSAAERAALEDPAAPIVLLPCRDGAHETALAGVAPGAPGLGVMLPASPLHLLLAEAFAGPLVATSGNRSGEPLCLDQGEAVARLAGIADAFLVHDRPIARPLDDSVLQVIEGRPCLLRRARGSAPQALALTRPQIATLISPASTGRGDPTSPRGSESPTTARADAPGPAAETATAGGGSATLLALGSDLKSAPALACGDQLWLSPHLGDLADHRCLERWQAGITELLQHQRQQLAGIAIDDHPQYLSTQLAGPLLATVAADGPPLHRVAHHRAHGLAVAAEHGLPLPLAALVLDGLGYGGGPVPLWGCELLWLQPDGASRLASLRPFPLPGGERAVREPRRSALGLLWAAELLEHPGAAALHAALEEQDRNLMIQAMATGCNSPWCSSAGRLFDAVAALLDLLQDASHESHAGLLLQSAAGRAAVPAEGYALPLQQHATRRQDRYGPDATNEELLPRLDWQPLLAALLDDIAAGRSVEQCAARFHAGLIEGLAEAVEALAGPPAAGRIAPADHDPPDIADRSLVLAGGCFQNRLLLEGMIQALRRRGWRPHWAEQIPGNDGGLAAGQILALRQATVSTAEQA